MPTIEVFDTYPLGVYDLKTKRIDVDRSRSAIPGKRPWLIPGTIITITTNRTFTR